MSARLNDEELMMRIRNGDRASMESLYDRYFDKLVWFANSYIHDMQKAEDAVQEIFIQIIEKPQQFDIEKKFSTWIYNVTSNASKNILRNDQNRLRIINENMRGQSGHSNMHHSGDYEILQDHIVAIKRKLKEKERRIFTLRFEEGLGISEIAGIIDIHEGSVKSGIYYLLKKFSVNLKEFIHEE